MTASVAPHGGAEAEAADALALAALTYVLQEPDRVARFLSVTGVDGIDLPRHLNDRLFLGGVLDFVLEDETLLGAVAAAAGLRPERVAALRRRLPGAPPHD